MTEHTQTTPAPEYAGLRFDADAYRDYVSDMGLTLSQQNELLEAVWTVVVGVVDLRYNLLGPEFKGGEIPLAADSPAMISLLTSEKENRNGAAIDSLAAGKEDS